MLKCRRCDKEAEFEVKNYFIGEAKAKVGPHLPLCKEHAVQWDQLHPFQTTATKIKRKSKMKFSDGMEFDMSGSLRAEHRSDGWYVVGKGMLIPVNTKEEADKTIKEMNEGK